ncbi:MAG: protein translocase subunit SecD [Deltaproteobacteria bacterium]|nr:protein translocase subunit SecD [Deltaproteobacteria bacterium]
MARNLLWRFVLVLIVIVTGIFYLMPSVSENLPPWWISTVDKIHLGLDLQGGMHLILEVQTEKAVENGLNMNVQNIEETLDENKIPFIEITLRRDQTISVEFLDRDNEEQFKTIMENNFPSLNQVKTETGEGFSRSLFELDKDEIRRMRESAVKQALETIRNRIDQFGVTEPIIQRQGPDRLLIQLPGIKDPERAKNLLQQTAMLEFKLLNEEYDIEKALKGSVPPDSEILYQQSVNKETGKISSQPFLLYKRTILTGDLLEDAQVRVDSSMFNEPYVAIKFNPKGAKIFKRITTENVNKRLAIILDNKVRSAPVIREPIPGGRASIEGSFTMESANDLAIILRAGSLPAPVKILEERTVGPSLGKDSIDRGIRSILIGAALVVVFIILYYNLSGVIANIALLFNMVLIFGALAGFKATLTLPGIAGIVLVIGMAVDANVLIFERIREELRSGKTTWAAIDGGYSKAFLTIIDANITTLIAAVVLFQFGTGPVKGFAVTLCIGIIASLFTAIVVTRVIFDYLVVKRKINKISI